MDFSLLKEAQAQIGLLAGNENSSEHGRYVSSYFGSMLTFLLLILPNVEVLESLEQFHLIINLNEIHRRRLKPGSTALSRLRRVDVQKGVPYIGKPFDALVSLMSLPSLEEMTAFGIASWEKPYLTEKASPFASKLRSLELTESVIVPEDLGFVFEGMPELERFAYHYGGLRISQGIECGLDLSQLKLQLEKVSATLQWLVLTEESVPGIKKLDSGSSKKLARWYAKGLIEPSKDPNWLGSLAAFQRLRHIALPWSMLLRPGDAPTNLKAYLPPLLESLTFHTHPRSLSNSSKEAILDVLQSKKSGQFTNLKKLAIDGDTEDWQDFTEACIAAGIEYEYRDYWEVWTLS